MSYLSEKKALKAEVKRWKDQCKRKDPTFHELTSTWSFFHERGKELGLTCWLEDNGIPKPPRSVEVLEKIGNKSSII